MIMKITVDYKWYASLKTTSGVAVDYTHAHDGTEIIYTNRPITDTEIRRKVEDAVGLMIDSASISYKVEEVAEEAVEDDTKSH